MSRYLTIDVEGLESFNDKCNQLSKQGGIPIGKVIVTYTGMALMSTREPIGRYVQQWLLPDSPGPGPKVSTEEL